MSKAALTKVENTGNYLCPTTGKEINCGTSIKSNALNKKKRTNDAHIR